MFAVKSIKNKREYMEDRYAVYKKGNLVVGLICDGHGGSNVAEVASTALPFVVANAVASNHASSEVKIANALCKTIYTYAETLSAQNSGSTLTGFVSNATTVYIFNIGDSRTCIHFKRASGGTINYLGDEPAVAVGAGSNGSNAGRLCSVATGNAPARSKKVESVYWNTIDHNPDTNRQELDRVGAQGGRVSGGRLNGTLAMTRSIGDANVGAGLCRVPNVYWVAKSAVCPAIFLYSDGLYENVKSTPHHLFHIAVVGGVDAVVDHAIKSGSEDNITALVVRI